MALLKRLREHRRTVLFSLAFVLVLLAALGGTAVSSRVATDTAIESVSEVYLEELSEQVVTHFESGLDNKFCQLETVGTSVRMLDADGLSDVQDFLHAQESSDDYAFLALRSEAGLYYTADGIGQEQKPTEGLSAMVGDGEGRDIVLYGNSIALVQDIDPVDCGDIVFTGVVAGYDSTLLSRQLDLDLFGGRSRSSMIERDGACIMGCDTEGLRDGGNLLDALGRHADLGEGQSIEQIRADMTAGEACLVPLTYDDSREYLYLRPIADGSWYLCTAMPTDIVDSDIAGLTDVLVRNAVLTGGLLVLATGVFFFAYYRSVRRSTQLLAEAKVRAEEASEQAQRANLAKSEFLSRMSHEIRTPMNGIMGMTAIALQSIGDDERVRECLEKVTLSSRHLMSLINDILDMSKIESGKIEIKREPFDFSTFVASLTAVFSTQAAEQGVRYRTREVGALPRMLVGDALRLNQIVFNLVGNAFKFTPPGGSVVLSIERLDGPAHRSVPAVTSSVTQDEYGDSGNACNEVWVRFAVSDTGCGIKPEHFTKIFSSFEQCDGEAVRGQRGTGLGLSITKRFVEMMGGSIRFSSAVGKGSTFTVDVPLGVCNDGACRSVENASIHPASDSVPASSASDGDFDFTGRRFLVAEDNELNREIAVELVSMTGAQAVAVETGAEALRVFAASEPGYFDLVLMDVQMPEMDGLEATRAIRSLDRPDARSVPILAMTANAFVEDEERTRLSGMDGHLSKPLDIQRVYATIDKFLRKRRDEG